MDDSRPLCDDVIPYWSAGGLTKTSYLGESYCSATNAKHTICSKSSIFRPFYQPSPPAYPDGTASPQSSVDLPVGIGLIGGGWLEELKSRQPRTLTVGAMDFRELMKGLDDFGPAPQESVEHIRIEMRISVLFKHHETLL